MNSEIFTGIGLILSSVVLVIVFWDHFKDDRLLTKRVQEFYKLRRGQ